MPWHSETCGNKGGFSLSFLPKPMTIEPKFSQVRYFIYKLWYTKCGPLDNIVYRKCPMALMYSVNIQPQSNPGQLIVWSGWCGSILAEDTMLKGVFSSYLTAWVFPVNTLCSFPPLYKLETFFPVFSSLGSWLVHLLSLLFWESLASQPELPQTQINLYSINNH